MDCFLCPREFECKNIKTILVFFDDACKIDLPLGLRQELEDFRTCLILLEYRYPLGEQNCKLMEDKEVPKDLAIQGLDILKRLYKYRLTHRPSAIG